MQRAEGRGQRENEEMCEFEIQDCAEDLPLGLGCAEEFGRK
jgi:hypothetical protein